MEEATEVCWYCKGEPRFSATSFCGVCYGTGYAPRSTRMRAEFNDGPLVVSSPCPSCESLRAELSTLRGKLRELDAWIKPGLNDWQLSRKVREKLRELGLISVDAPQTKE